MSETFTLVIFELIPEETKFFLIPNSEQQLVADCVSVNGKVINGADTTDEEVDKINACLEQLDGLDVSESYQVQLPLFNTHITQVATFGFFL